MLFLVILPVTSSVLELRKLPKATHLIARLKMKDGFSPKPAFFILTQQRL